MNNEQDIQLGKADVWLPDALAVKYPDAPREWGWQNMVFAARKYSVDPRSQAERRHHVDEKQVQRYVKKAALAAGIVKPTYRRIPCATALLHMFYKLAMISARYRNC